jgi:hypothetical protein
MSTTKDNSSKIIVIGGKKQSIADVQKSFAELDLFSTQGAIKIVNVLLNTKEPLTRDQLATQTGLSVVYIITILDNLNKYDYVASFHLGTNLKRLYYALTEIGYNALCTKNSVLSEK